MEEFDAYCKSALSGELEPLIITSYKYMALYIIKRIEQRRRDLKKKRVVLVKNDF